MIKEITSTHIIDLLEGCDEWKNTNILVVLPLYDWVAVDVHSRPRGPSRYSLWAYGKKPILRKNDSGDYMWDIDSKLVQICMPSKEHLINVFELTEQDQIYHRLKGNSLAVCIRIKHD